VPSEFGIVVFGDVAASRRDATRSSAWLRRLTADLDDATADHRLARFGFTQGDELQGLLDVGGDPFAVILRAALASDALPMRWAIAAGPIDRGRGPATQRTGGAFIAAREALSEARRQRDAIAVRSGDAETDAALAGVAPALAALIGELTDRQRIVARLLIVDALRQVDAATRLGIARPTVSVLAERAHVREIHGLAGSLTALLRAGIARWSGSGNGVAP
jgi:predicted XRE-type DNA-binding protein